tara:strand:+ start:138276 stop:139628 length:1353 start_codon:yes stop_codon:yes gene_type:complete
MEAWIFIHNPLEQWMANYKRTFDAWQDGGVTGIVVGNLYFDSEDGSATPVFKNDPSVYQSFGVTPPTNTPRDLKKERLFMTMLDDAANRGWHILTFGAGRGGGSLPVDEDPYGVIGQSATIQDAMNALPQAHGMIIDGPGEQHYELAFHHGGELFEIRPGEDARFSALGYDMDRLQRGIEHLRNRFHRLTPPEVRYRAPGGMLAGLQLFDINEDALYWLRARGQTAIGSMTAIAKQIKNLNRRVELGGIPRTAAFSSLTCQDYYNMSPLFDYIFPKHYYWHRGFDGMYGTIARWIQRLQVWNPSISEEDAFAIVKLLFGIDLPGVNSLMDMEMGFPEEFYSTIVYGETHRALEAIGDPEKVICWVSTGRSPHAGDAMPARDLHGILTASQNAGLKRFLFHPDPDIGAAEWHIISNLCGNPWKENVQSPYWPPDTPRLDSFSHGRKPTQTD